MAVRGGQLAEPALINGGAKPTASAGNMARRYSISSLLKQAGSAESLLPINGNASSFRCPPVKSEVTDAELDAYVRTLGTNDKNGLVSLMVLREKHLCVIGSSSVR
jgi:hypothetical protein